MLNIDLKMPVMCRNCGYECCKNILELCTEINNDYSPCNLVEGTDYCDRNKLEYSCKSFPLKYDYRKEIFELLDCHGIIKGMSYPEELLNTVDCLNNIIKHVDAYEHHGPSVELVIKKT